MTVSPRLAICIATLNRAPYLDLTLASVLRQSSEVQVVVVDGASTDDTPEVMQRYAEAAPGRVKYVRLPKKGGVDQDFARAVEEADAEYCWLMSDDDLLIDGAIDTVCRALADAPSLVIANAEVRDAQLDRLLEPRRLRIDADRVYQPAQHWDLFRDTIGLLSFIGAVVIRRDVWQSRDIASYFGSWFVHVGVIFQAPLPRHARVLATPLVSIRFGAASWTAHEFDIWMRRWPSLLWSFDGIPEEIVSAVTPREPYTRPSTLLAMRAKGAYGPRVYRELVRPNTTGMTRLACAAVAFVPGVVALACAWLYYRVRRPEYRHFIEDLRRSPYHWRNWSQ